jgi:hypothetical protein
MSILAIVCLGAIIVAFVLFAAVLAWGDYQTRDMTHPTKAQRRQTTQVGVDALKDAAAEAREPVHAA